MVKSFCLITGASSGLGRAMAVHFSKLGFGVLAVARRENLLEETKALGNSENITVIPADVSTADGREKVALAIRDICPKNLKFLIQNAGVIGEVTSALKVSEASWRTAFSVNVDAPLFLLQKVVDDLSEDSRILHVSSGAAHRPISGWVEYNTTKAAFHMMYQCLREELKPKKIHVGSVRPGIVESPMQVEIRKVSAEDFPSVGQFIDFKANEFAGETAGKAHAPPANGLDTPENVAHFVEFLLLKTSDDEFVASEWDIRETAHHDRWIN